MSAVWVALPVDLGGITATKHVRIPLAVVTVTPAQVFLGLDA